MVGVFFMQFFKEDICMAYTFVTSYKDVYIDGIKIHAPAKEGVEIHRDIIQSANTKRTSSGKMKGTNIAVKFNATFSFPPGLTPKEISTIKDLVTSITFEHKLKLVTEYSTYEEYTVYFGDYSSSQYAFIGGKMMNQSLSCKAVEV